MFQHFIKYFALLLGVFAVFPVQAQTFATETLPSTPVANNSVAQKASATEISGPTDETMRQLDQALKNSAQKNSSSEQFSSQNSAQTSASEEDVFIPEGELFRLDTPTLDGTPRGGQAFVEVDNQGRMKKATKIFIYYDQFKMKNYSAKLPTCNVRFNVLSNLDRKISQLDVKLVWPDLTTTLSFSDIFPNTQTYYNYALLSKGCYNMDKAPNIIVNRCRVKGMTAAECADKIVWLSK